MRSNSMKSQAKCAKMESKRRAQESSRNELRCIFQQLIISEYKRPNSLAPCKCIPFSFHSFLSICITSRALIFYAVFFLSRVVTVYCCLTFHLCLSVQRVFEYATATAHCNERWRDNCKNTQLGMLWMMHHRQNRWMRAINCYLYHLLIHNTINYLFWLLKPFCCCSKKRECAVFFQIFLSPVHSTKIDEIKLNQHIHDTTICFATELERNDSSQLKYNFAFFTRRN